MEQGDHRIAYRSELPSGVYLLRIDAGGRSETIKLGLVR